MHNHLHHNFQASKGKKNIGFTKSPLLRKSNRVRPLKVKVSLNLQVPCRMVHHNFLPGDSWYVSYRIYHGPTNMMTNRVGPMISINPINHVIFLLLERERERGVRGMETNVGVDDRRRRWSRGGVMARGRRTKKGKTCPKGQLFRQIFQSCFSKGLTRLNRKPPASLSTSAINLCSIIPSHYLTALSGGADPGILSRRGWKCYAEEFREGDEWRLFDDMKLHGLRVRNIVTQWYTVNLI